MNRNSFLFLALIFTCISIDKISAQSFTSVSTVIKGTIFSASDWGDYDNDGDLDLIVGGSASAQAGSIGPGIKLYRNNGNNVFTVVPTTINEIDEGDLDWGDYDNDGDLDLLITGAEQTHIYRNDGSSVFTDIHAGIAGATTSSVAWGDYDNDGFLDFIMMGTSFAQYVTKIYRNNRNGTFTDIQASFIGIYSTYGVGDVTWGDSDNDGDLDLLFAASTVNGFHTVLYINEGNGVFVNSGTNFQGVYQSSANFGDYDNDGDLDILIAGRGVSDFYAIIYRNDGNNVFIDILAGLAGVEECDAAWGDYDNDGDLDALICGGSRSGDTRITKIYRNTGNDVFHEDLSLNLSGISAGTAAWGDSDNDGDLDLFLSGSSNTFAPTSLLYRNDIAIHNNVPATPLGLSSAIVGDTVIFSWDKATDAETRQAGLSYNFYIGTTASDVQLLSPMANINTGYRRIVAEGNAGQSTTWKIANVQSGQYYWCVQAIDAAFSGSPFCAVADTFTVQPCLSKTVVIPNLVTRNNDGKNDFFELKGFSCPGTKLTIYNDWGALVFTSENYQNDWDGGSLIDGVYYYELEDGGHTKQWKGWVQLIGK